jgi:transposase
VTRVVSTATEDLPAELEALRAFVLTMMAERDAAIAERDELATRNERLQALLLKLRRMQFGRKSERLPAGQLTLALEDLETAIAEIEAEAERGDPASQRERAKKRRASRAALPAHLPRIEVVLMPPDTACPCCKAAMVEIDEDRSSTRGEVSRRVRTRGGGLPKGASTVTNTITVASLPMPRRTSSSGPENRPAVSLIQRRLRSP